MDVSFIKLNQVSLNINTAMNEKSELKSGQRNSLHINTDDDDRTEIWNFDSGSLRSNASPFDPSRSLQASQPHYRERDIDYHIGGIISPTYLSPSSLTKNQRVSDYDTYDAHGVQLQQYYHEKEYSHSNGGDDQRFYYTPQQRPQLIHDDMKIRNSRDSPSSLISADGCTYTVRFKRASRHFLLSSAAPRDISIGDFVRVEADRGEDIGVVQDKIPSKDFRKEVLTAGYRGRGFSCGNGELKWILRLATTFERLQIRDKVEDESTALAAIREKVTNRHLPMKILDAEYQYDRHKLVFFFESDRRIDFRELVSELFSLYKTRIWMQQIDASSLDDEDSGTILARQVGLLPPPTLPEHQINLCTDTPDRSSSPLQSSSALQSTNALHCTPPSIKNQICQQSDSDFLAQNFNISFTLNEEVAMSNGWSAKGI